MRKLSMQHNNFGEVDLRSFAEAISEHQHLEYLDISANNISSTQFNILFPAVKRSNL